MHIREKMSTIRFKRNDMFFHYQHPSIVAAFITFLDFTEHDNDLFVYTWYLSIIKEFAVKIYEVITQKKWSNKCFEAEVNVPKGES